MSREVSGFHLQISLDIGEFFGIPREQLVAFFPGDVRTDSKFSRVDWEPFAAMTAHVCKNIGEAEALIPAGQRYTYERIGTRFTHLMTQFGGGWDRVLWATKHFFSPRLIRGYEMGYRKLGHNHFELTCSIPPEYTGCEPYFWLFAGIWTGGNKISRLKHEILSLEVHPHGSKGEIRFAERNRVSRVVFNSGGSRWKAWQDLRRENRELQDRTRELKHQSQALDQGFEAVSDAVFRVDDVQVHGENALARELLAHPAFLNTGILKDPDSPLHPRRFPLGERMLEEVNRVSLSTAEGETEWMITLRDCSEAVELEQKTQELVASIRKQAGERVEEVLGRELQELAEALRSFLEEQPEHPARPSLESVLMLTAQCRRKAKALVDHHLREFADADALRIALKDLARECRELHGFELRLLEKGELPGSTPRERGEWFLLFVESVRNAYRHSGGTRAELHMDAMDIRVLDNGSGLTEAVLNSGKGLGCDSIRNRAARLGWSAQLAKPPENGWIFTSQPERI